MRCYREFQLPGIDNLCDNRDFSAAKQATSIARQYCKAGVLSELYGVTQWDFDFKGYKLAGDWQAALGITVRVPHLAWASMNGESKRDYPAAIGWQSPWYEDFSYIEDHYARVNYCMTRGKPVVRVGVLHTVESFWLLQGPAEQVEARQKQLEEDFQDVTQWLRTGGIDFDYIAESSLADEPDTMSPGFRCGDMTYDVVLVPSCINLRGTTLKRLQRFAAAGGSVIFLGDVPAYVDCRRNPALAELIAKSGYAGASRRALLEQLAPWREVDILERGVKRTKNLLYQMRQEENCRWLFIAQAYRGMEARQEEVWYRRPERAPQQLEIRVRGMWNVRLHDTLSGEIREISARCQDGWTIICHDLYGNDSLLLQMEEVQPGDQAGTCRGAVCTEAPGKEIAVYLPEPAGYRMSEPNVLLLDRFEFFPG